MKIIKRLLYVILTVPVVGMWFTSAFISPFYWIITGDKELLCDKFGKQSIRLSKWLRDENE